MAKAPVFNVIKSDKRNLISRRMSRKCVVELVSKNLKAIFFVKLKFSKPSLIRSAWCDKRKMVEKVYKNSTDEFKSFRKNFPTNPSVVKLFKASRASKQLTSFLSPYNVRGSYAFTLIFVTR